MLHGIGHDGAPFDRRRRSDNEQSQLSIEIATASVPPKRRSLLHPSVPVRQLSRLRNRSDRARRAKLSSNCVSTPSTIDLLVIGNCGKPMHNTVMVRRMSGLQSEERVLLSHFLYSIPYVIIEELTKGEAMACDWRYLPILKWKRGEQFALRELTEVQWSGVTPLIELQPIDAAPDGAALRSALPEYLEKVADQIEKSIPEDGQVFVDTHLVSPGYARPASLLVVVCDQLRHKTNRLIYPVVGTAALASLGALTPQLKESIQKLATVLLRLRSDEIESSQILPLVADLTGIGIKKRNTHLLVDQYSLVSREAPDCVTSIEPYLIEAVAASCASVTLAGGSFPMTLTGIKAGARDIPRVEWGAWRLIAASGKFPRLRYADYTVTYPAPLPDIDPKTVNPSITIRYATNDHWHLLKGRGFKGAPPGEYRNLCKLLVTNAAVYSGKDFSFGDSKYFAAANGGVKNGIPWTWRREATSHHIVLTASSL